MNTATFTDFGKLTLPKMYFAYLRCKMADSSDPAHMDVRRAAHLQDCKYRGENALSLHTFFGRSKESMKNHTDFGRLTLPEKFL